MQKTEKTTKSQKKKQYELNKILQVGIINTVINILVKKIVNLSNTNKIHSKCDCIDGSIQNGLRQSILFSFVLDKPAGYKVFCESETIHYKKINKSVLNTITFYLDNNNEEVDFNQETLTFTLQMIKI